ncbi:hypothetical protein B0H10DRAFT_2090141 [Mycena sp. CBHHK59/15]|nr:hypothetical protein B0H10DRAFT_2105251 [Mycena sp. CBHHK59/15]KAJ6595347.1 hypothetical protein B0H10DRAFT_2090141 [Mycena sp. CBHHK59/15]
MNGFQNGTRVFYWNGAGQIVYDTVFNGDTKRLRNLEIYEALAFHQITLLLFIDLDYAFRAIPHHKVSCGYLFFSLRTSTVFPISHFGLITGMRNTHK